MIKLNININTLGNKCTDCQYLDHEYLDYEYCILFNVKLNKDNVGCFRCCDCHAAENKTDKLENLYED